MVSLCETTLQVDQKTSIIVFAEARLRVFASISLQSSLYLETLSIYYIDITISLARSADMNSTLDAAAIHGIEVDRVPRVRAEAIACNRSNCVMHLLVL